MKKDEIIAPSLKQKQNPLAYTCEETQDFSDIMPWTVKDFPGIQRPEGLPGEHKPVLLQDLKILLKTKSLRGSGAWRIGVDKKDRGTTDDYGFLLLRRYLYKWSASEPGKQFS